MMPVRSTRIRAYERGLLFKDRDFVGVLQPGRHWFVDPLLRVRVDKVSVRAPWLAHQSLDVIARSGELVGEAQVLDLKDHERALVWIDGRFDRILGPGLNAVWTVFHEVRVEMLDAREIRLQHDDLASLIRADSGNLLDPYSVDHGHEGLLFVNGEYRETLRPGLHAFWRGQARVQVVNVDRRETVIDIAGQEIMTSDKVTLRLNAVLTWSVVDPLRAATEVEDFRQALYREAQLALRAMIGTRDLDSLLAGKDEVATELGSILRNRALAFGVKVTGLGIRDVILPGEMKDLMNRVTEARKAAEAALITRREETAAMRSQANTARLLESNPTLMRLRELEVLEKVAGQANLQVLLGEGGLTDRVVKLL